VNNVGIFSPKPLHELSFSEWKCTLDVNLSSVFLYSKICAPALKEAKGAIVSLASTRARQSEPDTEAYAASKGGIVALTHALAISLGPDVRVNCISPGWIDTRSAAEKKQKDLRAIDHAQHPVGRVGEPEDVARLAHWLLSEEAGFITGQEFVIDGGMTRKMIYAE
jgi:NAD(P)-dependent dehydrogenase (short-subunit alcohol dehydrogenase family)